VGIRVKTRVMSTYTHTVWELGLKHMELRLLVSTPNAFMSATHVVRGPCHVARGKVSM
jgi:hypothetical protein